MFKLRQELHLILLICLNLNPNLTSNIYQIFFQSICTILITYGEKNHLRHFFQKSSELHFVQTFTILKNAAEEASTDFFTQLMFSGVFSGANREILVYLVCVIIINNEPKENRSISRSYFLLLSLIVDRVCCVVYKFVITYCNKIKAHSNSYQRSLFHLHENHPYTCS